MLNKIIKYRLCLIAAVVALVSLVTDPVVGNWEYGWDPGKILMMAVGLPFLYALPSPNLIPFEKWIFPLILGTIFCVIVELGYLEALIALGLYDDEHDFVTWDFVANLLYYAVNVFGVIFCISVYEQYRRRGN